MQKLKRIINLFGALALLTFVILQALPVSQVHAATEISPRSLTLVAGSSTTGGSEVAVAADHEFQFTLSDTTDALGSIVFQYCTTAAPVTGGIGCDAPSGISTASATIGLDTGVTGFTTIANSSKDDANDGVDNVSTVERTSASTIGTTPVAVTIQLNGVVNPSTPQTFFVRISTYTATNGTGTALESGTVAAATSDQINLSGTMPESLVFCAGATVGETSGVPNCSTVTTGTVNFNQLFSPTSTSTATSQMAASTNAQSGYAITVNGATLTSGTNTITAISGTTPTASTLGVSQFGMNLVANTTATSTPAVGAAITPASGTTNYNGQPTTNYGTPDKFLFNTGDTVANSNSLGTNAQIYTVSYIVNVPGSQPAGTYSSTLTYICTPTY